MTRDLKKREQQLNMELAFSGANTVLNAYIPRVSSKADRMQVSAEHSDELVCKMRRISCRIAIMMFTIAGVLIPSWSRSDRCILRTS